ncbi:hypothetical protein [Paraliomyxa miuraensis]|uniref:hypothetical protein n=1 Tax=Paraliomyxa miuraensis TaxID=376150 RepID=UPI002258FB16|nr:hypothetical protein [Paraliomyxa miuraensis]MCX4242044.1 hypothetical protein [Paraliomyxa miuraensis]
MTARFDFDRPWQAPFELAPVTSDETPMVAEAYRSRLFVHTVHDGDVIPQRFRTHEDGRPTVPLDQIERAHVRERDWGANLVAESLAMRLGLPCYGRVRIARALLDFNRFPGSTPPGNDDPLERLSINPPFCNALTHLQKMDLLDVYDHISDRLEANFRDKLIVIGVHTYDERNPSATSRPHLSLVNIPAGYLREARMPYGVFDPIYPDGLGESTCSRILRDRISLNLERAGFRVISNHPYSLPEGSIEVRSQVWYFFSYARMRFEAEHPATVDEPAHALVWQMLLNTNLRQALPESLRGHLHRYQRAAPEHEGLFREAAAAYERIQRFIVEANVGRDYRRNPNRPSSLALEVRKDLLCEMDATGEHPQPPTPRMRQRAHVIARVIAGAIRTYLETDRELQESTDGAFNGGDPSGR